MSELSIGNFRYILPDNDAESALAHAIGSTFIELQQLEYSIISYLRDMSKADKDSSDLSFEFFASNTFGGLIKELEKNEILKPLSRKLQEAKNRRNRFVHSFLFNRYGGPHFTDNDEYISLIEESIEIGVLFHETRNIVHGYMFENSPLLMIGVTFDSKTGEYKFEESKASKELDS